MDYINHSKQFPYYVWTRTYDIDGLHSWLIDNLGEPFYRESDSVALMVDKRWSILSPIGRNIAALRVHFADANDALLFKLRWG
jgi:hypothetical protein